MADANTPAWMQDNTMEAPAPAPLGPTIMSPPAPPTNAGLAPTSANDEDDPDLPGVILTMRLVNMGVAVALIAVSILIMITRLFAFSSFIMALYACFGGLLICCLETQLKFIRVIIALNFGFLFNSVWRFIFYLLLGSVTFSFDYLPATIVGYAFFAIAVFNTYVLCRYPSYRKIREKIAEEEDKRIEARISKEVKKQAVNQFMGSNANTNNTGSGI